MLENTLKKEKRRVFALRVCFLWHIDLDVILSLRLSLKSDGQDYIDRCFLPYWREQFSSMLFSTSAENLNKTKWFCFKNSSMVL